MPHVHRLSAYVGGKPLKADGRCILSGRASTQAEAGSVKRGSIVIFECSTVTLQRRGRDREWRAEVSIAGAAPGPLTGMSIVLNVHSADGWELVALAPMTYQVDELGMYANTAIAIFKRPFQMKGLGTRESANPHAVAVIGG